MGSPKKCPSRFCAGKGALDSWIHPLVSMAFPLALSHEILYLCINGGSAAEMDKLWMSEIDGYQTMLKDYPFMPP